MDFATALIIFCIAGFVAFLLSFLIPIYFRRRWKGKGIAIGCLLQVATFIMFLIILPFAIAVGEMVVNRWNTMVCVQYIEEDRDCRYSETWRIKGNGTCIYEVDKGSHHHAVIPCGNDYYSSSYEVSRVTNEYVIEANLGMKVYFDMKNRQATALYASKEIEVVDIDWDRVETYFKKH